MNKTIKRPKQRISEIMREFEELQTPEGLNSLTHAVIEYLEESYDSITKQKGAK